MCLPSQYKGQWNQWALTRDETGKVYIYLNGEQFWTDANFSPTPCGALATFRLGKGCPGVWETSAYTGRIDEVRLYNYGLSATEIRELYQRDLLHVAGQIGRWPCDEGSGTSTADTTPFGHDATLDHVAWSNGRIGAALAFTGKRSSMSVSPAALLGLDAQATVALWLKVGSFVRTQAIFEALDLDAGPTLRALLGRRAVTFDAGGRGAAAFDRAQAQIAPRGCAPADRGPLHARWNHWVFTKNATTGVMNLYLNGALWHSETGKHRPLRRAARFRIGSDASGGASLDGLIDDLRIYNVELSPSDVRDIYLDCPPLPTPMTWSSPPRAVRPTAISMRAATASHPTGVEYFFRCTAGGGHDSGWQPSPTYTDAGLAPRTKYSYEVRAREIGSRQRETAPSPVRSVTTPRPRS